MLACMVHALRQFRISTGTPLDGVKVYVQEITPDRGGLVTFSLREIDGSRSCEIEPATEADQTTLRNACEFGHCWINYTDGLER